MKTFSNTCFLLHLLSIVRFSTSSDTMQMQILRDGDTIVSSSQTFELGFFSPGSSQNRYVGIWFKNIPARTVVWVANRESPLRNAKSGALRIDRSGNLVIVDESNNATIWSTNTSGAAANPVVQLLNTGNLVIREASRHDYYLWQSFDYLTDTLIPGMTFGWNIVTGKQIYQSSWKTIEDPAQGEYTMGLDITGYPQFVIKRGDVLQNRLGPFNGKRFSGSLNVEGNDTKAAALIINNSVVYYTWFYNQKMVPMRYTINPNGVGELIMWVDQNKDWVDFYKLPADICDGYKACGAYGSCNNVKFPICRCLHGFVPRKQERWAISDWSGGCVRRTPLNCGGDGFLKYSGIKMPDARLTRHNSSSSLEECRTMCLGNCSCTAYSNLDVRNGGSGCLMWFGDLLDIRELTIEDQEIYIRMAASELGSKWTRRSTLIAVLTSFAGLLLLIGLSTSLLVRKGKKYRKLRKEDMLEENNDDDMELRMHDLSAVTKATNNFSAENKLGEGGFGPVYKGILEEGKEIAVKRLSETSSQGLEEFKNEVICIAKLQHRNLVKLLGWCTEGEEKMLIYEYMPNKSLDVLLFNDAETKHIDWPKRLYIIHGIARGLLYLHHDSCLRVIHRDLKASNVLLDSDLNPKISDFGMAKIFRGNETEGNTKRVVGTYGYMSPEYAVEGFFSLKSDVYSFGVLVLEIVSGQTNRGFHHDDHHHNLVGHAWMLYKQGSSLELVDPNIGNSIHLDEVLRSIHVALLCVQECPDDRPSMSSVVVMFGSGGVLPEAKEPGFFIQRRGFIPSNSNECTITQIEGR